jgi:hypothetical protein
MANETDRDWVPLTITRADLEERIRAAKIEGVELAAKWLVESDESHMAPYVQLKLSGAIERGEL